MRAEMKRGKDSETIALEALAFIAADDDEISRFLTTTGMSLESLRAGAGTREILAAALGHVLGYEPIARAFAEAGGYTPDHLARAAHDLGLSI